MTAVHNTSSMGFNIRNFKSNATYISGWLTPFSNTFGYGLAAMLGIKKTIRNVFKDPEPFRDKAIKQRKH